MVEIYKVIWDKPAVNQLKSTCQKIREDSLQHTEKFRSAILTKASSLNKNPYRYPADKFRKDKDTCYRAVEVLKQRITYYIDEPDRKVIILRVRSVRQEPLEY